MYYNTNNESGVDLRESWIKTAKQNELILKLFMINPNETFTADEMLHLCEVCNKEWPITSIRRAITTLTDRGNLTKTKDLRKGKYGKETHTWKFITQVRTDINDRDIPGQGNH
tara:strand:- start:385 stop:723 length:339 start_codon:yes stop_codon:yes gene_type:complete